MDHSKLRNKTLDPRQPFAFSQASLQDYRDCRRRFQLRYLQRLRWPAAQAEPIRANEEAIQRGERFHRLAQQALLGLPANLLEDAALAHADPALAQWWHSFVAFLPALQEGTRLAEIQLSAPLDPARPHQRLLAKYDLIQLLPDGRAVIYDWKTSPKRPRRAALQERLQTRVYPCLLAMAGASLNRGQPFRPEQIEMVYWFACFPDHPERFTYSPAQHHSDLLDLRGLAAEITRLGEDEFARTDDDRPCKFCVYRSLCERGAVAGLFEDCEDEPEAADPLEIDFEQISEVSF